MIKRRIAEEGNFRYHLKCAKQGITHLSFADDLFLFSAADPNSVQVLKDSLDEFGRCSGLWPNKDKSNIYFGNVAPADKSLIHSILEFNVGSLPVRYLGVPLISSRLWVNDCRPLIQKVRDKIESWENKWLNYAGRVQLDTSVLLSLQVYWSSIFLLPISVTKQIEKLIRSFIWSGRDVAKGKAKVAWKDVCLPKQEGGLGLKSLRCWNKALMSYHVWNIVSDKSSLWLQGVVPRLSDELDRVVWISRQGRQKAFSVNQVWDDLRATAPIVEWCGLIWYSKSIPKHCFTLWLAIRNRLLTQDRLKSWQIQDRVACSFCDSVPDSVPHLLFECVFCSQILLEFQRRGYLLLYQGKWDNFIHNSAASWRGKSVHVLINKLVLAAVVFHIWQERNRRLFQQKRKHVWQIIAEIVDDIRRKLQGLLVVNSLRVREELSRWDVFIERPSIQN
ncbi:hypothetical protein DCAR_0105230 [Daucus carota subsp. sativus]|uniref:Reverse transcriptase zinc-binding domain-containing protein n=1 Tax=Daucus carota subsp. sativus TaxID=79200 RepID=A0AAF0WC16_DAUCS|nr:hypothetical protein DCAR_0105230 [Daucus carota subsp. sativus]